MTQRRDGSADVPCPSIFSSRSTAVFSVTLSITTKAESIACARVAGSFIHSESRVSAKLTKLPSPSKMLCETWEINIARVQSNPASYDQAMRLEIVLRSNVFPASPRANPVSDILYIHQLMSSLGTWVCSQHTACRGPLFCLVHENNTLSDKILPCPLQSFNT